ncbi:hypothetical protein E8E15_005248 [Penicillium rubens]|uniref:Pc18g05980 protein n=2 Tax=Penicillium chrysogenum species complex TaxID=254878 RepID=B6HCE4_PENRW|nr:uncharacterized protein N7525_000414 [Penicillium rubens]KZN92272.1 hypothetical protein EN45_024260 [Penicillium chrysogenum]CAP94822.1 Pc18g05980 [Penicillium rubens Wisconsin 54-1255]KAF3014624.1 hypothetical protein E8E15_005248 [Penicillium rubens]KAJ5039844.1 hypothetical protein NUH16_009637 [Penicillium rubens]KAJ5842673.1 hypothetical protein N7525_000414 [Penicillium rubens]
MEAEETKGLAVSRQASPVTKARTTSPDGTDGISIPLPASPVIKSTLSSPDETEGPPTPLPASPVIEPITSLQSTLDIFGESDHQIEKEDAQPGDQPQSLQFHYPVMRDALKALIDNAISVVEYGNQVLYRCGYAEVLILVEWVVPDEQLLFASQVLLENDYPRLLPPKQKFRGYSAYSGSWETQSLMHDLDGQGWMRVHLLPLSLVGFTLEETVEVPSTFDHELHLLTPKPAHYMSSLIRHLLQISIGDSSRVRVLKDIGGFISAYILKDGPANTTVCTYLNDPESDEDYQKRVEEGVRFMKTWDWGNIEERYLAIAERAVRDCRYIDTLTDVN